MALELYQIISAFFSLGLILAFVVIGITISSKYFKYKNRTFLFMGLFWICLSQNWWSSFINVLLILTNINTQGLSPELYFLLSSTLLPLTGFFYIVAITDLIYKKYQKLLTILEIINTVGFEVICIYSLITNPSLIITKTTPTILNNSLFIVLSILALSTMILIFGFLLSMNLLKANDPEVELKGKLLIIAYILFLIGGLMDTMELPILLSFIDRIILILSSILFYFGFILPDWMKKIFIKGT